MTSYGYHVMLYIGDGLPSWKALVEDSMINQKINDDYTTWDKAAVVTKNPVGMSVTKR